MVFDSRPYYSKDVGKITSKLQVTLPKHLADEYGLKPGDSVEWEAYGEALRVLPPRKTPPPMTTTDRLKLFDAATRRLKAVRRPTRRPATRGWSREDLYGHRGAR
jgi:bifunctional DNA-binding transcriptional regulator/antitoxin component of YhaV-PrlF toxin-antitoxin module